MGMAVKKSMEMALAAFCVLLIAYLTLTFWWTYGYSSPVYVPGPNHRATVNDGVISVYREYTITRSGELEVYRDLIRRDGDTVVSYELPRQQLMYYRGQYKMVRELHIPARMPNGVYELHTYVSWWANPFRRDGLSLPIVIVDTRSSK
jgi:hypothetical protein